MKDFYKAVFGWKAVDVPGQDMEYTVLQTVPTDEKGMLKEPGVNGGLYKRSKAAQLPVNYIQVESIEEYLDKAVRKGAKLLMPKTNVPGKGFVAWIADPEGNPLGLIQPKV